MDMGKTITLADQYDSPQFSLLRGHHDLKTFNEAFQAEGLDMGWSEFLPWDEDDISHEYWVEVKEFQWYPSNKTNPKAVAVTIASWDSLVEEDSYIAAPRH